MRFVVFDFFGRVHVPLFGWTIVKRLLIFSENALRRDIFGEK